MIYLHLPYYENEFHALIFINDKFIKEVYHSKDWKECFRKGKNFIEEIMMK